MRHFVLLIIATLLALGEVLTASAQAVADTLLPEAVTIGFRRDATLRASTPTFLLDTTSLRRSGATDITTALRHLAGVNLRDYGGAGGLKTVSVRGIGATHTCVTYDGIPMADTQGGTVDVSRFAFDLVQSLRLDIADASPLLVPVRSLTAATLDIGSTAEKTARNGATIQLRTGSWELLNPAVTIRRKLNASHTLSGAASYSTCNNNYSFRLQNGKTSTMERRNNSQLQRATGEMNWHYQHNPHSQLRTKVYYSNTDSHLPGPVKLYNNSNAEELDETLYFAQSRFDYTNKQWDAFAAVKAQRQEYCYTNPDPQYPKGALDRTYLQSEAYATGGIAWKPLHFMSVAYATDYFYNYLSTNYTTADGAARHTLLQNISLRLHHPRATFTARLIAHNGWNKASKQANSPRNLSKISPSVSVAFHPLNEALTLRAFYKDYYRQPTFSETYFYHLGTPLLNPERSRQVGGGITYQGRLGKGGPIVRISLDGYYNDLTDKISSVPYNLFVWRTENRGKVVVRGADATLYIQQQLTPKQRLIISANYSYQDATDRTSPTDATYGKQAAYTPYHSGAANVAWENPWVNCGITFAGASSRWATNNHAPQTQMSGYGELGATLYRNFNLPIGMLKADLSLHNILNKNYEIVRRYPMPTRSFVATVTYIL